LSARVKGYPSAQAASSGFTAAAPTARLYSKLQPSRVSMRQRAPRTDENECAQDSEAVLGVWLPAPLPTPRALPDHGAIWPLAVGVEKDLGGIDV